MCVCTYQDGSTHHNQQHKIDPVPEGVGVLHVVHNISPALQTDHLGAYRMHIDKKGEKRENTLEKGTSWTCEKIKNDGGTYNQIEKKNQTKGPYI